MNQETSNGEAGRLLPEATGSAKYVPFTIICPEIKPGQGIKTREISVEVREEYGEDILTAESMERIETSKMQMMLTRLAECVRELYGNSPNISSTATCGPSRNP